MKVKAGEKRKWEGLKLKETERLRVERTRIGVAQRDEEFSQRSAGECYQSSVHFSWMLTVLLLFQHLLKSRLQITSDKKKEPTQCGQYRILRLQN